MTVDNIVLRTAVATDLEQLICLENASFDSDRLSGRRFKHWLFAKQGIFVVACRQSQVLAYGLVITRKGTRLARLYSIAVSRSARGLGLGKQLLLELEERTLAQGKLFMRLEVATTNHSAIKLYESLGYRAFGTYNNYYDNDIDALRMQKSIAQNASVKRLPPYPWYQQTTEFSCGPAALMMAMANLDPGKQMNQSKELLIWRQATTIFMTSGHGGCHPVGLALAAEHEGFKARVFINTRAPLFISGVRSAHKKQIMQAVDKQFHQLALEKDVEIVFAEPSALTLRDELAKGAAILCLISTYQFDGKKVPHWVAVTHLDDNCLYLHDPDPDELHPEPMESQHIPVALDDFQKMSAYGKEKVRTLVLIYNKETCL